MKPSDFPLNRLLIFLKLAHCAMTNLTIPFLPNLRHLDVSFNQIIVLNKNTFNNLPALQDLKIGWNPLNSDNIILSQIFSLKILSLDISGIQLINHSTLHTIADIGNTYVNRLNLSHIPINWLPSFFKFTSLKELDLRNVKVNTFEKRLFLNICHVLLDPVYTRENWIDPELDQSQTTRQ